MKKLVLAFAVIAAMSMVSCNNAAENTAEAQDTTATEQVPAAEEATEQAPAEEVKEGEQAPAAEATEQAPAEEQKAEEQPAK